MMARSHDENPADDRRPAAGPADEVQVIRDAAGNRRIRNVTTPPPPVERGARGGAPAPPAAAKAATPFVVARHSEPRSKTPLVLSLLALVVLAGTVVQLGRMYVQREDPHYVTARGMIEDYEQGTTADVRNYGDPVYSRAVDELRQVDPGSRSAEPARALLARIERDTAAFEAKRAAQRQARAAQREQRQERDSAMQGARERAAVLPASDYPECEEEEH